MRHLMVIFSVLGICLFSAFKNGVVVFFEGMKKKRTCYSIIKTTALVVKARLRMRFYGAHFCLEEKEVKVPKNL